MNEEILGGLKSALERGESLQRAMMTFFNAGYNKEEIEEAARALSNFKPVANVQPAVPVVVKPAIVAQKAMPAKSIQPIQAMQKPQKKSFFKKLIQPSVSQKPVQKVSNYGAKKPNALIPILIALLIFLLGILAVIFLFKNQLMSIFGKIVG